MLKDAGCQWILPVKFSDGRERLLSLLSECSRGQEGLIAEQGKKPPSSTASKGDSGMGPVSQGHKKQGSNKVPHKTPAGRSQEVHRVGLNQIPEEV